jgi:hypothetical protein
MPDILLNEKKIGIVFFVLFIIMVSLSTFLGISPLIHSVFQSAIFTTLIASLSIAILAIKNIGLRNFAGKAFFCFGLATLITILNTIIIKFNFNFNLNEYLWISVSLLIVAGIYSLLTTYKLTFPKYLFLEIISVFIILFLTTTFFLGFTQILNLILITTGIFALKIPGKKIHCGIVFLSVGIILLSISNLFFIYRHWNGISYFGDISDITFLTSWFSIVTGIYFTKKHYA